MSKKTIWIIASVILVLALLVTGVLFLLPKNNQQNDPEPTEPTETRRFTIIDAVTVGEWALDRADDEKIGPSKSYDEFIGTYWNPQAPGNYQGEPGIVYLLDGYYDLTEVTAYFANREYFFKLYVSSDCKEFTQVFEVNAENMSSVFDKDYCCKIAGLNEKNVAYLKFVFTGSNSPDNNAYISLRHVKYDGTWVNDGPDSIPIEKQPADKGKSIIADYLLTGYWIRDREDAPSLAADKSFDSNVYVGWQPQANGGYVGDPGIVYMLNGYYDLTDIKLHFDKREYFFKLYASTDGLTYTQLAEVTADNYTDYYDGLVASFADLTAKDVGYVRIIFTGSNSEGNNTYVTLLETQLTGNKLDKPAPTDIPNIDPDVKNSIIAAHRVTGSWILDREDMESLSPAKTYDENPYSSWGPQANGGYKGNPGIVYMLDGYYDVDEIQLLFARREYYFDLYTSSDGYSFSRVVSVHSGNWSQYFKDLSVSLKDLNIKNVGYVKIVFTGSHSKDGNTYVNLMETVVRGTKLDKEAPSSIPDTDVKLGPSKIADHKVVGAWILDRENTPSLAPEKSYDSNLYAGWQPQTAGGYSGKPGIIYMLKGYYDVSKVTLTFDKREYFFELYTSSDGISFNQIAKVTKENMTEYYKGLECNVGGLDVQNVGFVKIVFTGSNTKDNNTFITLQEVQITGTRRSGNGPSKIPAQPEEQIKPSIIADYLITGQWILDRENTPSLAADKSFDENLYTSWQPQTPGGYAGNPGIIYMLDGYYDLTDVELNFDRREYFFDLYTSNDGLAYSKLVSVTAENYTDYYTDLTASFAELDAKNIGFVKIVFTGSNTKDNNTFITLLEIQLAGTKLSGNGPSEIPDQPEAQVKPSIIADYLITGQWILDRESTPSLAADKSFDENLATSWQPQTAGGYAGDPAIIYMLDGYYDLTDIELNFDRREYFFDLYTSNDGLTYSKLISVTAENYTNYYTDLTASFAELDAKNVGFVKIVFTGSNSENNNTFITLIEVQLAGTKLSGNGPSEIPAQPEEQVKPSIIVDHKITGQWVLDRESTPSLAADKSYDANLSTSWQPQASGNYAGNSAIIYMLDGYYDLTDIELNFDRREYFFELYTSTDGLEFTKLISVTAENYTNYYTDLTASFAGLDAKNIGFVKIVFTGSNSENNNSFITLLEVQLSGTKLDKDAPVEIPDSEVAVSDVKVAGYKIIGSWILDREANPSLAAPKSYDGDLNTAWQPQASGNYAGTPGIIYMLDGYYNLSDIALTFMNREYFFDLYTSADGVNYTQLVSVNAGNYKDYFTDLTATISGLDLKSIGYIKVIFTASNSTNNNTFVNVKEVELTGVKLDKDAPAEIPEESSGSAEKMAKILSASVIGSWANDRVGTSIGPERTYDGSLTTNWNPAVTGFTKEAAIVYTFEKAFDLTKLELTFGSRRHYIVVSVSSDGESYTEIATVNSGNAAAYFTDLVCTLSDLTANNVKYVKLNFIGTENGTTWINLMEVQAFGTE